VRRIYVYYMCTLQKFLLLNWFVVLHETEKLCRMTETSYDIHDMINLLFDAIVMSPVASLHILSSKELSIGDVRLRMRFKRSLQHQCNAMQCNAMINNSSCNVDHEVIMFRNG
jgi:hypothetical protein